MLEPLEDEDDEFSALKAAFHYATPEALDWLRALTEYLLTKDVVPAHLAAPLILPPAGQLFARFVLARMQMTFDLWRRWLRPLKQEQVLAYELSRAVEGHEQLRGAELRYLAHLCATASAPRLREVLQELLLTGQVNLPLEFQQPEHETEFVIPQRTLEAKAASRAQNTHYLRREADLP